MAYAVLGVVAIPMVVAVIVHECGHYLFGLLAGGKPSAPLFVPLGIGVIGITKVVDFPAEFLGMIAAAGPLLGASVGLGVCVGGLMASAPSVAAVGGVVMASEVVLGVVGKDGTLYRKWRKDFA